jgi:hypothetical protein
MDFTITVIVAVTKLHASRSRKDFKTTPPPPPSTLGSASSELSSLAWAPLFVLQQKTILLCRSMKFGDGYYSTIGSFVGKGECAFCAAEGNENNEENYI